MLYRFTAVWYYSTVIFRPHRLLLRQVVCLSVRPSVRNVEVSRSWSHRFDCYTKIISRLVSLSLICSLSADPDIAYLLQGEHPKFWPKVTHPLLIERHRHRMANCGAMVTMVSLQETNIALSNGTIDDPLRPPLPQNRGLKSKYTPGDLSNFKWPYHRNGWSDPLNVGSRVRFSGSADRMAPFPVLSNPTQRPWHDITWHDMTGDIDKSRAMSPFAKLCHLNFINCHFYFAYPLVNAVFLLFFMALHSL